VIFQSWFFHYLRQSSFKNGNHSLQEKKREKDRNRKINREKDIKEKDESKKEKERNNDIKNKVIISWLWEYPMTERKIQTDKETDRQRDRLTKRQKRKKL
jgi:hypothetical protein